MEKTTQLATVQRMTPGFVEQSMVSIQSALEYANILLKSKLVPLHFYEKKQVDGKWVPDYENGKPEAVVLVLQHGMEIGLSITQSLQQVVPVNGLISLKGDGAKSLIFSSGASEVWDEKETGSIEAGDFTVTIFSRRKDGKEKTVHFSLMDGKRAGLYYSDSELKQMLSGTNEYDKKKAYAFKNSAWFKYPARMVQYRAIGWLARDLYPHIINGMMTMEEAMDIPQEEGTTTITTPGGKAIKIAERKHEALQSRSEEMSSSVTSSVEKQNGKIHDQEVQDASIVTDEGNDPPQQESPANDSIGPRTEQELIEMKEQIYLFAKEVFPPTKYVGLTSIPQKKTNKLCREGLLAWWAGTFDVWLTEKLGSGEDKPEAVVPDPPKQEPVVTGGEPSRPADLFDEKPGMVAGGNPVIPRDEVTRNFEAGKKEEPTELVIQDLDPIKKRRPFDNAVKLYEHLTVMGLADENLETVLSNCGMGGKFSDVESLCNTAEKTQIEIVIQKLL